jgi:ribosomal protein S6--L-glutamate ligase/tetrahydromethanopterin:alpha-L-glutamate ligase
MKMGIVTRNENSWSSTQLREAMIKQNVTPICFSLRKLVARVGYEPKNSASGVNIVEDLPALIVRPIPPGSLEEIIFRLDALHRLERLGVLFVNPPLSIERSVDKYHALTFLEEAGLPVPRTAVTESHEEALKAFHELGGDVVVKPLFGSRGIGSARISDADVATRVFRAISLYRGVIYLQEYVPHGVSDIRAFVVGGEVIASMRRVGNDWKTNVSQGAKPVSIKLSEELEDLAVTACNVIGCKVAGVDLLEGQYEPVVVELNSQPGWKGLQSVTKMNIAAEIVRFVLHELRS